MRLLKQLLGFRVDSRVRRFQASIPLLFIGRYVVFPGVDFPHEVPRTSSTLEWKCKRSRPEALFDRDPDWKSGRHHPAGPARPEGSGPDCLRGYAADSEAAGSLRNREAHRELSRA